MYQRKQNIIQKVDYNLFVVLLAKRNGLMMGKEIHVIFHKEIEFIR
jgi:hypothetical protein